MIKRIYVPITKVDAETGIVEGIATREEIDKAGEIVSFEGAKKAFAEWSDYFMRVSDGESHGNIRSMHDRIAAGKAIGWAPIEDQQAIFLRTKIVDDNELKKCQERVYNGFSIGFNPIGPPSFKMVDGKRHRFYDEFRVVETSLVDSPMCDSAMFTLVKRDDPAVRRAKDPTTIQTLIFDKAKFTAEEAKKWAKDNDFSAAKTDEPENEESIRIRQRDPGDFDEKSFRIISLKPGVKAVVGHLKKLDDAQITRHTALVLRAYAATRYRGILRDVLPRETLREMAGTITKGMMETASIQPALVALSAIQSAIETECWECMISMEPEPEEVSDIATLTGAAEAMIEFLLSEFEEQRQGVMDMDHKKTAPGAPAATLAAQPAKTKTEDAPAKPAGEATPAAAPAVPAQEPAKDDKDKTPAPAAGAPAPAEENKMDGPSVMKAIREVGEQVTKEVANLGKRVTALETRPAPIGNPVQKTMGGPSATGLDLEGEIAVVQKMADEEKDPQVRAKLLEKVSTLTIKKLNFG